MLASETNKNASSLNLHWPRECILSTKFCVKGDINSRERIIVFSKLAKVTFALITLQQGSRNIDQDLTSACPTWSRELTLLKVGPSCINVHAISRGHLSCSICIGNWIRLACTWRIFWYSSNLLQVLNIRENRERQTRDIIRFQMMHCQSKQRC